MTVGIAGDGPATEAVRAALGDVDATVESVAPGDVGTHALAVVVAPAGDDAFDAAAAAARAAGAPWLAVETGGVGGHAVDAVACAVAGFGPATGCYDCLRTRVAANAPAVAAGAGDADAADVRLAGGLAGRAAASMVGESDSADGAEAGAVASPSILGRVVEVPHAERGFLPVPGCPTCGDDRDRTLDRTYVKSELDDSLERAERALDERVGVVSTVGEVDSYPAPYYLSTVADTSDFSDVAAAGKAAGVATDWNAAFMKALGEGLERYAAGVYRTSEFSVAPPASVDGVPPADFVRPDGADAPAPDDPVQWVPGYRLADGSPARLPAGFVHYPPPERFAPPITTGLGLERSPAGALLSGLYEVVERDATMLSWYSTFEPLGLTVDDDGYETLARRARSEGLSVTPLLVTQDVDVPVVTVAVHREGDWPRFAVGSDADLDAAAAARGALEEAVQNWMEMRSMGRGQASAEEPHVARYADRPAAAEAMLDVDGRVPASSVGPDRVPDGAAELELLVSRATDAGLDPHAARVTTRDLAAIGFEVVRVVAPSAQPLFTDEPFFGDRARNVPESLGFEPRLEREHHPYP